MKNIQDNGKSNYTISSTMNVFLDKFRPKDGWDKDRIYVARIAAYFSLPIIVWNILEFFGLISEENTIALILFLSVEIIIVLLMYRIIFKK